MANKPKPKVKSQQQPDSSSSDDTSSSEESSKDDKKIPDLKNTCKSPSEVQSNPRDSPPILEPQTPGLKQDSDTAANRVKLNEKCSAVKDIIEPAKAVRPNRNEQPPTLHRPIRCTRKSVNKSKQDVQAGPSPKPQTRASTRPLPQSTRKQSEPKSTTKVNNIFYIFFYFNS